MIRAALCAVAGIACAIFPAKAENAPASAPFPKSGILWVPGDGDVISFDVLRQGKPFGFHEVSFARELDGELRARTRVFLKAGLGFVTLFRYELDATETWVDGELVSLTGEVNEDGQKASVRASSDGQSLDVKGTAFNGEVAAGMLPASHWNARQVNASKLLSTEDGQLLDVSVREEGMETLNVQGVEIRAHRYLMESDIDVTLWYDDQGRWVKLSFSARGQDIEYVLKQLYD